MALRAPRICCLDLDTFFVSVERLHDPSLIGKPVVVGGLPGQRGVVTCASYEVRALGVRSGMSLTRAFELAPKAIYLPTRHGVYGDFAARVRCIAESYTPASQVASIDCHHRRDWEPQSPRSPVTREPAGGTDADDRVRAWS